MEPSANPVLVQFRDARTPAEWTSKQAKRMYDDAIAAEQSGQWFDHVVTGSVKVDVEPTEPFMSTYGTEDKRAAEKVRYYIARQRALLLPAVASRLASIDTVEIFIVQPNAPGEAPVKTWRTDVMRIIEWGAELDRMEQTLAAYGGNAFVARREAVRAPKHPFDAEAFLISVMRRPGVRAIWVHGVKFVRNMSGAFARAE